jgi:hypothetical protein
VSPQSRWDSPAERLRGSRTITLPRATWRGIEIITLFCCIYLVQNCRHEYRFIIHDFCTARNSQCRDLLRRLESRMSFERRFQSIPRRSTPSPAVPQIPSFLIDGAPERMIVVRYSCRTIGAQCVVVPIDILVRLLTRERRI